MKDLSRTLFK